jgi:ParB/RepB/Spo0J family partition protein
MARKTQLHQDEGSVAVLTPPAARGWTRPLQSVAPVLLNISIERLQESPLNPRRRFHEASLAELGASIREHGILTPVLARPIYWRENPNVAAPDIHAPDTQFELAAGHRRLRAAAIAELAELPVLVRDMTDVQFIEILTIDNLQREDVHPLEEAQGFADLIKHAGYDVGRIAERIGRSHRYVYDRLRLLQLTDELQQIFFDGEITAGHAVLLARLSADDQKRALNTLGAVFTHDAGELPPEQEDAASERELQDWEEELELDDRRKPMSVRELQSWIDKHVRFDEAAPDVPDLFPETAAVLAPALEQEEKIVKITHENYIQPEARAEDERTIGPRSWKRADGQFESATCDRSVVGVVAVGPGRGEAFRVCIDKKKCGVHWGAEMKESARRASEREKGERDGGTARGADFSSDARSKAEAARVAREAADAARRAAFETARPAIMEAIVAQVKKQRTGAESPLGQLLIQVAKRNGSGSAPKGLVPGSNADHLVRYLGGILLIDQLRYYNAYDTFPALAKKIGVDVAKILKGDTEPRFPEAGKKKPTAKKKVRR